LDALPTGWFLCDGTNGTPDLRDKFVVGSGGDYTQGVSGGSIHYKLTMDNIPSHSHNRNPNGKKEWPLLHGVTVKRDDTEYNEVHVQQTT